MKIKLILLLTVTFLITATFVYSQVDITQLESLQNFQEVTQDIDTDEEEYSPQDMLPEKTDRTDGQLIKPNYDDNFGYKGRSDFLVAPNSKFDDQPLERFGYDYFLNNSDLYLPTSDIPIPPDYVLGPGDSVKMILFGNQNKTYNLQVTREGDIFLPDIGPVSIAGLTFQDLKETINEVIQNQLIGTKATLTLGNLRSINIFVLGEALKPGMYTVSSLSTLTNALFTNGGINSTGSLRNIQLKRNGKIISEFDFYDLLLKGDTSNDLRLMSGDVVFIPPTKKLIGIAGEVKRPGIYELRDYENAEDLIGFAGGLRAKADLSSLEIETIDSLSNSFKLIHFDSQDLPLVKLNIKDGDKLSIYSVAEKLNSAVLFRGHTPKPGFYPWVEGMKILDFVSSKGDLLPMTDLDYVLVKRESEVGLDFDFIQINLQELFEDFTSENNIDLKNRDEIIFFPSMLDVNLIKTLETEADYNNNDAQLATYYAKKSIKEMQNNNELIPELRDSDQLREKKYFHYYIYDYCVIAEDFLEMLFMLNDSTETEVNTTFYTADETNIQITKYCRDQIIEPLLALIEQQSTPLEPEKIVTIFGNVAFPGRYPLTQNASVKNGLAAAGGLRGLTYTDEIDISRKSFSGKSIRNETKLITVDDINNTYLQPLDTITIKKLDYLPSSVTILGEVYFPGTYPIADKETFTSLITRVGGFKDTASLENIFFQRRSLISSELKRFKEAQNNLKKELLLASQEGFGSSDDSQDYLNRILMLTEEDPPQRDTLGRLVLDINNIYNRAQDDLTLSGGDKIVIPKTPQTVKVIGEVFAPNSHFFDDSKDLYDYISLSGGFNDFADEKNVYVIRPNGSVFNFDSSSGFFRNANNKDIRPGDTVVVPLEIETFDGLRATTEITQIIYQMALSAAAVNSF